MKRVLCLVLIVFLSACASNEVEFQEENPPLEAQEKVFLPKNIGEYQDISNKRYDWGMRKIPPNRPEFTKEQTDIMEKHNCIYMGSKDEKVMYLTFDEGYENGYTEGILDTLKETGVVATFFVTGQYFDQNFDLIKRMVEENHEVGNHTQNHINFAKSSVLEIENDILALERKFYSAFNKKMKYLRPPEGVFSERSLCIANDLGYRNVFWSFAYLDWDRNKHKGKEYALNEVTKNFHNGAVILLHAVSKDNEEALKSIIEEAQKQGYTFKSLDFYK